MPDSCKAHQETTLIVRIFLPDTKEMPSHLRLGHVVGKRVIVVPEPFINCACSECMIYEYYDHETSNIISGQRLTKSLFKDHKKRDRQRLAAAKHFVRQSAATIVSHVESGHKLASHSLFQDDVNSDKINIEMVQL